MGQLHQVSDPAMSEKLCLKWNDFQDNTNAAFGSLRNDNDFSDVTLACEDDHQIEAHKVILAAASPFFENLLRRNKHPHPMIYMRGVKSDDLLAIVDFLYYGEANVFQENIDAFLALAEELNLKGLTGNGENQEKVEENIFKPEPTQIISTHKSSQPKTKTKVRPEKEASTIDIRNKQRETTIVLQSHSTVSVNITDIQELDEKVKSMMAKSQNIIQNGPNSSTKAHICTMCGKEGLGQNIKDHIEAKHLEGVSIPCNLCDMRFRSRRGLRRHIAKHNT